MCKGDKMNSTDRILSGEGVRAVHTEDDVVAETRGETLLGEMRDRRTELIKALTDLIEEVSGIRQRQSKRQERDWAAENPGRMATRHKKYMKMSDTLLKDIKQMTSNHYKGSA